ncbi:MAG TPA: C2H2-type zinc finger protein [Candidatus Babeliales bacterium]|jgi:hypothetical protein|nr:C2H2-type zinc finger protein [Candidatus Babeliales bacterium]
MHIKKIIILSFFLMSIALYNTVHGMKPEFNNCQLSLSLLQAAEEAEKTDLQALEEVEKTEKLAHNFSKVKTVKRIRNKKPKVIRHCKEKECIFSTKYDVIMKTHGAMHKKMEITPDRVHDCQDCGYLTDRPYLLREHLTTHCDERDYPCPHCTFVAKTDYNLKKHLRNQHLKKFIDV